MSIKTKKPDKSIKIKVIHINSFENGDQIKSDIKILSNMEFKMLMRYNSGERSLYLPTAREAEVIKRNIQALFEFKNYPLDVDVNTYDSTDPFLSMACHIYNDIQLNNIPNKGYNKRALVCVINKIKIMMLTKYPEFVVSIKGEANDY